ncbi:protein argonaute-2 [Lutzomyia longipalpis]|uniref:protein argonaute-2 n=1 Tax=Lutzomyia longipalpis TaxID=7200 RepID=UPI002483C12B|nr:protein argonaute-2 [Lutzomyia longipalpis]
MENPEKKKKRNRGRGKGQGGAGEAPGSKEEHPSSQPGTSKQHGNEKKTTKQTQQSSEEKLTKDFEKKMQIEDSEKGRTSQGSKDSAGAQQGAQGQGKKKKNKQGAEQKQTGPPGKAEEKKLETKEVQKGLGSKISGPPGVPMQSGPPRMPQQAWPQRPGAPGMPQQAWPQQTGAPGMQQGWPQQPGVTMQSGPPGMPQQAWPQRPGTPGMQQGWPQQPGAPPVQQQGWPQQPGAPGMHQQAWPQQPGAPGMPQQAWPQQPGAPGMQQGWPQQLGAPEMAPQQPKQALPSQHEMPQQARQPIQAKSSAQEAQLSHAPQQRSGPPSDISETQSQKSAGEQPGGKKGQKKGQKKPQSARDERPPAGDAQPTKSASTPTLGQSGAPTKRSPIKEGPNVALCPYKGPGKSGRKVTGFLTNYVKLNLSKLVDVAYHYDVAMDPDRPKKLLQVVFEAFRLKHFPNNTIAYDRAKNAYTIQPLNIPPNGFTDEITIDDPEMSRKKTFKVSIQETDDHQVRMSLLKSGKSYTGEQDRGKVLRAHQCLEIILRMAAQGGIHVGRQYYWKPPKSIPLDGVMELWQGIYQSAIFGQQGPLLNVDITNKGFPMAMPVLKVFENNRCDLNRMPQARDLENVKAHLNGLNISYAPKGNEASRRVYKFLGFKDSAQRQQFTLDDGKTMTVEQYFAGNNMRLKFPHLPLLHVGPKDKNIYLPAEFCTIPGGQAVMKKLTDMQTRTMIKETATSTDVRKERILNILRKANFDASPIVRDFGIGVGNEFVDVDARILNAPKLEYANKKEVLPNKGVWYNDKFIVPTTIDSWAILVLQFRPDMFAIDTFAKRLIAIGGKLNMTITTPPTPVQIDIQRNQREFEKVMNEWKGKVKILLVVIPGFGDAYKEVKRAAEGKYGILTQCVKHQTVVQRGDESTVTNILLKMNSKLNGLNHRIHSQTNLKLGVLKDGNFMVVGADVTHPSPDQRNIPSIVGVAASYDEDGFRYTGMWRIQDPRKEMIDDLAKMIEDHLYFYKKERKGLLPHTILYYRDGVGEGDFQRVLNLEFQAIRQGASRLGDKYKPNIVFIVVQKRHHTRFFPGKSGISVGKNNNVPPGTIVDTKIVPMQQNQFFLVAHQAIQGVAKPTKYCVLVDEANISIDDLQGLTYNLCHMFTRCNRSVSYVAPTYYAHLMAARGKVYVEGDRLDMNNLQREYEKRKIKDEIAIKHPMFFV